MTDLWRECRILSYVGFNQKINSGTRVFDSLGASFTPARLDEIEKNEGGGRHLKVAYVMNGDKKMIFFSCGPSRDRCLLPLYESSIC